MMVTSIVSGGVGEGRGRGGSWLVFKVGFRAGWYNPREPPVERGLYTRAI